MKVLVYQIGSLGDTLVSIPTYRAVRRHFGEKAMICVVHNIPKDVRATPQQVLAGSGLVDDYLGFHQSGGRSTFATSIELLLKVIKRRFDAAVYIGPGERSARAILRDKLFFQLCGIRTLIGFHPHAPGLFSKRDDAGRLAPVPHEADIRLERLAMDGVFSDKVKDLAFPLVTANGDDVKHAVEWLNQNRRFPGRPLVAVCPGANQPAKYWQLERFIEIGSRLINVGYEPVVIGGPTESVAGRKMVEAWDAGANAAGQFSVLGSTALLSLCDFLVGLDTGTTHLAASLGLPCVALYADRDPAGQWTPLGDRHVVLIHQVPCGGCGLKDCTVPGHPCMTNITAEQVWGACQATIRRIQTTGAEALAVVKP
ncbi:MAG: glycosyltransferase family 9 protein [Capsulimonadaceae bacterium]